jgi:putative transcriptional regulator
MQNSIKELRRKACLTQEELAKKANISRTHLAEIENGNAIPSVLVAQKIAKALKTRIDKIFFAKSVV